MSRDGARWAITAAAVVAATAGALAVLTAAAIPAVVAGVASALVAVLVLIEDPEEAVPSDRSTSDDAVAVGASDPQLLDVEDVDPLRELFESGPPAGGSGLLGAEFVLTTLRGRVAVARRALRPLSIVCFEAYATDANGNAVAPVRAEVMAAVLQRTLREADVSGYLDGDAFVCILEDTGEDGAVWTAERIRRTLMEDGGTRRFRAGVASYPAHGLEPEELEGKARTALIAARDWATDRIEVAGAP